MVATRVETPAHQPSDRFSIMPEVHRKKKMCPAVKVIVLGNAGVGKTSLLAVMAGATATPGVDFRVKMATLNGDIVKLQLWDTANQEAHSGASLPKSYYRRARGVLLVYDASNEQSFVDVVHWAMQLQSLRDESEPLSIVVVSNQTRSKHQVVSTVHGRVLAMLLDAPFVEWTASHEATPCLDQLIRSLSVEKLWQVDLQGVLTRFPALSTVEKPEAAIENVESETESESEDSELETVEIAQEILPSVADIIATRCRRDSRFFEALELGQASSATAAKMLTSREELGRVACLGRGVLLACPVVALLLLNHYDVLYGTCSIILNALAWASR